MGWFTLGFLASLEPARKLGLREMARAVAGRIVKKERSNEEEGKKRIEVW